MERYLLDTNVLIHYARSDFLWVSIRDRFGIFGSDVEPLISVVSRGEVLSFARRNRWGRTKLDRILYAFGHCTTLFLDQTREAETYALLDSDGRDSGLCFGQNDLWIAATAALAGATILTTDRDFLAMDPTLVSVVWIDPRPGGA